MKALLSPIFSATYGVSYLTSSYLAAASLTFFALARIVLPLITQRIPLLPVTMALFSLSTGLYALAPTVIAKLPVVWLLALKTLTGASYAGAIVLLPLLCLEVCGSANYSAIFPYLGPAGGVAGLFGPASGYYLYEWSTQAGYDQQSAYDAFFWVCAVLEGLALLNVLALWRRLLHKRCLSEAVPK